MDLRQIVDPIHNPASLATNGSEHSTVGGARFSHAPNAARQVISSPLAKLSMCSTLEEGGGAVSTCFVGRSLGKRCASEASVGSCREDSAAMERGDRAEREDSVMESDGESLEESVQQPSLHVTAVVGGEKTLQT